MNKDAYDETIEIRKTYDAGPHWDTENHPNDVEVFFRFTMTCSPNSRERLLQSIIDFDAFCDEGLVYLRTKFGIKPLQDLWDGPWWSIFPNGNAHQQNNYERVILPKNQWAGIQGILDQNDWERW